MENTKIILKLAQSDDVLVEALRALSNEYDVKLVVCENNSTTSQGADVPEQYATGTNYVVCPKDETVKVRNVPNTSSTILASLNNGIKVTVDSQSGSWSHITSPVSGYMMSSFLSTATPSWMSRYGSGNSNQNNYTQVVNLQNDLNSYFGYQICSPDGLWGSETSAAVLAFQQQYSYLSNDGIAGPDTKAFLWNHTH
jgi:predicted peroxiredoxin